MNTVNAIISTLSTMSNSENLSIILKTVIDDSVILFGSIADFENSYIITSLPVCTWDIKDNEVCIYTNYSLDGRYVFDVSNMAEELTTGQMKITLQEALIVEKVTNTANWSNLHEESYSGCFSIGLNFDNTTIKG